MKLKDYLNKLVLKINLIGFNNPQTQHERADLTAKFNNTTSNKKLDIYKFLFQLCIYDMNIKIIDDLYDYPYLVLFPIFESIHYAREHPCLEWPIYAFNLISRFDLEILKAIKNNDSNIEQSDRIFGGEKNADNDELVIQVRQNLMKEDEDGMQNMHELEAFKCGYNDALRLNEVRSCLQTTRPIQVKLSQGPDVSDHDFVEEEKNFLYCVCQRTMALPIGPGILTLHTINPIPTNTSVEFKRKKFNKKDNN